MEWKDIKGYEGYYQISRDGIVKSLERTVKQGKTIRHEREKIKKIHKNQYGYPCVTLCKDRKSRSLLIHRILAIAFIPNPDNKPYVDHINTDKEDYRLENLRWVTSKENANNEITLKHCRENLYIPEVQRRIILTKKKRNDDFVGKPRTVFQFTIDGVFVAEYDTIAEAARATNGSPICIKRVCDKKQTTAMGYIWSYSRDGFFVRPKNYHGIEVLQYDAKTGTLIGKYSSINEAARATGCKNIRRNSKSKVIKGEYRWVIKD